MVERSHSNGLLIRLSYVAFSIIPCAIVFGWSVWPAWPAIALWVVGGGARLRHQDRKVGTDCVIFGILNTLTLRTELVQAIWKRWNVWCGIDFVRGMRFPIILSGVVVGAMFGVLVQRRYSKNASIAATAGELPEGTERWVLEHPRPWIFPCRTTHARMFPKRHAFGYSYLLCGFPVVPAGIARDGADVGNGMDGVMGSWWLKVRAEDYLARGNGALGFYGKLKAYMREQDVEDTDWSYAYLVTAPRFFGYSFNPVSFWYVYNRNHELKKMILEVNNTFGERRIYLLDGSTPSSLASTPDSEPSTSDVAKDKFTDIWMKDFHVSPFNSRKGSYALKARNPFPSPHTLVPAIDNTITLKSSKDFAKIVARVNSTGKPHDPAKLGVLGMLRFVGGWWWVGLVTFPRIVREAFKLHFRRSLHVWFRPEVVSTSLGRAPTSTEIALQKIFKGYLDHLVNTSSEPIQINYQTAIPDVPDQVITSDQSSGRDRNVKKLDIHVTTPAFYSRFVHYAHTSEALDRECLFTDEKNRTLWISQPELLPLLLPKQSRDKNIEMAAKRSFLAELRWKLMKRLRCQPAEPAYPVTPKSATFDVDDIRTLPYSDFDRFVRGDVGTVVAGDYRRMVTKIFLAQRVMLGFVEMVDVLDLGLRVGLCWVAAKGMVSLSVSDRQAWSTELLRMMSMVLCVAGCHLYGLVKGYI